MAKAPVKITEQNVGRFFYYFQDTLNQFSRTKKLELNEDQLSNAKRAFSQIEKTWYANAKDAKNEVAKQLTGWVEGYISTKSWDRCLANFRQKHFHIKNRTKRLRIPDRTYIALRLYAQEKNLALNDALYDLLKDYDRLPNR